MSQPHAMLFTAPGCPHCPGVKAALEKLLAEGLIEGLELHDVSKEPEQAAALGIRSVPWLKLGTFILHGAQTPQQLREWAERAANPAGMRDYLAHMLKEGELVDAQRQMTAQPHLLAELLPLLEDAQSPIQVRLGVSAILEEFEGTQSLRDLLPQLIALSQHSDHRLRSDACYFLGLSHDEHARSTLQHCMADEHAEVREIAAEALAMLA